LESCSRYRRVRDEAGVAEGTDSLRGYFESHDPRRRGVMTNDFLCEKVLRIIIAGNLPFYHAENAELVDHLKDAYPDCTPPTRKAVMDLLKTNVARARMELVEKLSRVDSKVSLAMDCWTTRNNIGFLGMFQCNGTLLSGGSFRNDPVTLLLLCRLTCVAITSHYIDPEFKLHQDLLAFEHLDSSHTGEFLASTVFKILEEHNLTEKLFCITTDNARNNYKMMMELKKLLATINVDWDSEVNHIPCLAHVINLIVQAFLDALVIDTNQGPTFKSILVKFRKIAKSIRSSAIRWDMFKTCCESYGIDPMTIPLDITVRWNSTFRMLEQIIFLRRAIHRYVDDLARSKRAQDRDLGDLKLTENEWDQAEVLLVFLLPFNRCTARFECNGDVPEIDYVFFAYDSMYNHIDDVKKALTSGSGIGALACSQYMLTAISDMEVTLKQYYSKTAFPTVYGDGMILNPRCKVSLFDEESWEDADADAYVNGARRRFTRQYSIKPNNSDENNNRKRTTDNGLYDGDAEFQAVLAQRAAKKRRSDFDRYIEIPNDPGIPSSLAWWRRNERFYPDLALMARDVLAVPASGCAVERKFSISGRIASWQRNRLAPSTIADIMIYKNSLVKTRYAMAADIVDDDDHLPVGEEGGKIPSEWAEKWWMEKLKRPVRRELMDLFGHLDDDDDESQKEGNSDDDV